MQLQIYEILDDFKKATTREAKINVLRKNDCVMLQEVLYCTFTPHIQFYTIDYPPGYKADLDAPPGMGHSHLGVEMRKMYLFMKGHPASKDLSIEKRNELLCRLLESLEPREAEIVISMFRKNLPAVDLNADLVREAFPKLGI